MTMADPPWEFSQITERALAKHERRRVRRLLGRGNLRTYLGRPCPYCGVVMTDEAGPNNWRAPAAITGSSRSSLSRAIPTLPG
jgi:hypothetical protein